MNQRKLDSVKSKAKRLAKAECANFTGNEGCYVTCGNRCILFYESEGIGNVCPYFIKAVLPGDHKLESEYRDLFNIPTEKKSTDLCEECSRPIERTSNRQKYCGECRGEVRKTKEKKRQQERRYVNTHKRTHLG
ncbi:cysteine-rich VLP protein [Fictibacillus norfolkensis]|uniref:Cysteine-rich VLP protein n=1 Tax=Fictibacillus norfolkensis TaxID=2762233 RepID=A0ABR8SPS5_9BACL|nr:cysteine-rich VLP protein [Fictibacillus norfolkensis]MBD7965389.1 cysteine-rich VLP protein [Fictibacillus norfolkensis]